MFVRNIAGLCKGSTADSDSVCEGSNPSPAAKKTLSLCWEFFLFPWFCHRDSDPHTNSIRAQLPALAPGVRILLPLPRKLSAYAESFFFCHGSVIGIRTLTQIQSGRSSRRLRWGFESFSRRQKDSQPKLRVFSFFVALSQGLALFGQFQAPAFII